MEGQCKSYISVPSLILWNEYTRAIIEGDKYPCYTNVQGHTTLPTESSTQGNRYAEGTATLSIRQAD